MFAITGRHHILLVFALTGCAAEPFDRPAVFDDEKGQTVHIGP